MFKCNCGQLMCMRADYCEDCKPIVVEQRNNFENPMIRKHGVGPEATCKDCIHLVRPQHNTKVYRKCELRGITRGKGTDHKTSYKACSKFKLKVKK